MESLVEDDLICKSVMERLAHLPACLICLVNDFGKDLQFLSRHGVCSPATGICGGVERCLAPRACYLGEEPVLDGVELGAVRRVVHDKYLHSDTVGEVHEVLLDNVVAAGVRSAAVTEDDKHTSIGIELPELIVPHALDIVADKLGSVVAGTYREIARGAGDVVDAVRHNRPLRECPEVVVVDPGRMVGRVSKGI